MTFSLLFDLDDTLLDTNLDAFLGAYFKKLAAHMAHRVPAETFVNALLRSTQIMYGSKRMDMTLEQVFSQHFYPALGCSQAELAAELDQFYDGVFPTLGYLTSPRPEAVALVEWAFSKGWKVAIATDPLFPRKAILHRLRWAGLDPDRYPFTLISDFQSFHFAKASVAFYPEFLARMGWGSGPILMVGDSVERDIVPAQQAGVPAFWLKSAGQQADAGVLQGTLAELKQYLETSDLSTLKVDYRSLSALLAFLQATPAVMHGLSLSHAESRWAQRPQENQWAFVEILCHLRDVDAEVNLARLETILREDNAFIAGQITDQWAGERQYIRQDGRAALQDFVAARTKLVERLAALEPTEWERQARHTIFGPTGLRELVEFMVDHDRLHIQQACAALK